MPYDSVYSEKRPLGTLRTAWPCLCLCRARI